MIARKFGSPALPVLGIILLVASVGISLLFAARELQFVYVRTPDVGYGLRLATSYLSFGVGIVTAFNVAALSAPRVYSATSLGRYPLARQVVLLSLTPAAVAAAGVLIGFLPVVALAAARGRAMSGGVLLNLLACVAFLAIIAALTALIGISLRRLHPVISALVALLLTYFVVAFAANSSATWAVAAISLDAINRTDVVEPRNSSVAVLVSGVVALVGVVLVAVVARVRKGEALVGAAAVLTISGVAAGGQALAGPVAVLDRDVCATTPGGTEVCVDASDAPGLQRMVGDVAAVEEFLPAENQPPALADVSSYRIKTAHPGYRYFLVRGSERRLDIGEFLLAELGLSSCTDPTAEGAFVIDRVGVYIVNKTGAYSKNVEENGAFYQAYSDAGSALAAPVDELSMLPEGVADRLIHENWDAITSCQGSIDMVRAPAAR